MNTSFAIIVDPVHSLGREGKDSPVLRGWKAEIREIRGYGQDDEGFIQLDLAQKPITKTSKLHDDYNDAVADVLTNVEVCQTKTKPVKQPPTPVGICPGCGEEGPKEDGCPYCPGFWYATD